LEKRVPIDPAGRKILNLCNLLLGTQSCLTVAIGIVEPGNLGVP
jgi:hypothetical protein